MIDSVVIAVRHNDRLGCHCRCHCRTTHTVTDSVAIVDTTITRIPSSALQMCILVMLRLAIPLTKHVCRSATWGTASSRCEGARTAWHTPGGPALSAGRGDVWTGGGAHRGARRVQRGPALVSVRSTKATRRQTRVEPQRLYPRKQPPLLVRLSFSTFSLHSLVRPANTLTTFRRQEGHRFRYTWQPQQDHQCRPGPVLQCQPW
jgi:hypothetical protein